MYNFIKPNQTVLLILLFKYYVNMEFGQSGRNISLLSITWEFSQKEISDKLCPTITSSKELQNNKIFFGMTSESLNTKTK